ncbi:MAG: hypothetical protein ABUL48_04940 [Pseudorhodoplanes sp.]
MFRVTLGLATATLLAAASPASAGCCGSNWGVGIGFGGWGGGCCNSGYVQQQYVYQQPQYYVQPAAPIVVQAPAQQIIVQQPQPEVIFQQQAAVPSYTVDQGPYYAGPQTIGYSQPQYYADTPVRPYPYVSGYYNPNRYYGRPFYRGYRAGYRGYRGYGVYPRRYVGYRGGVVARTAVRRSWR